jgi:4-hydroxybenzoate polyprenyltransferase
MKHIIKVMRPKQWAKNLLVFAAVIFTGKLADLPFLTDTLIAFVAMCFISSATYIVNDIFDAPRDRQHPKKKERPIASGKLSVPIAASIAALLTISSFALAYIAGTWGCVTIIGVYILIQVFYNLKLKHVAIIDVFAIAAGFVLRAALGAEAINVPMSGWMFIVTGVLALTLGFAKRRNEFILMGEDRTTSRAVLNEYSKATLDMLVLLFSGMSCMAYCIYTMESQTGKEHPALVLTAPMVLYGVARYIQRVFKDDEGGEPSDLLFKDPHVLISVVLFIIVAAFAMTTVATVPIIE